MIKKVLISSSALAVFFGVSLGSTATAKGPTSWSELYGPATADSDSELSGKSDSSLKSVNDLFEIGTSFNSFDSSNRLKPRYRYKSYPSSSLDSGSSSDASGDAYTRERKSNSNSNSSSSSSATVYSSSGPNTNLPNADLPNADPNWH